MSTPPRRDRARRRPPQQPKQQNSAKTIAVTREGPTVTISIHGHLDGPAGDDLLLTAKDQLTGSPRRIDLDLRGLESYTQEGARALGACRELGVHLIEGLHYRTDQGPGREALLEGCEPPDELLAEPICEALGDGND